MLHLARLGRASRALGGRQGQLAGHGVQASGGGLHGGEVPDGRALPALAPGHIQGLRREEAVDQAADDHVPSIVGAAEAQGEEPGASWVLCNTGHAVRPLRP